MGAATRLISIKGDTDALPGIDARIVRSINRRVGIAAGNESAAGVREVSAVGVLPVQ